ncbi:phage holin family protein [Cellulosimicrobium cellulans]|uniref:phage holin family protein n=1 Tax=Cellulosimicrobium cellulans TaxID=1710 RepID=UPI002097C09B|nr:phage holin family protein [Cellulosimicrobium cellulans]MCO7273582.1 phage holin family protein [Cellulosimicrobium cellulans]
MIRFLLSFAINVVLAAVGLLVASSLFDGVTVHASGFVVAVLIFAVAQAILAPFVFNVARKYASAILGGIGLVSTFLALWVATLVGDGLEISGASTWIGVTVVVWLIGALGGWFLGWLVLTRWWDRRQEQKRIRAATSKG